MSQNSNTYLKETNILQLLFLMSFFIMFLNEISFAMSSFDSIKKNYNPSDVVITDSKGEIIKFHRTNFDYRRLPWTDLREISPVLIDTVIKSEDKRFLNHQGVDWIAISSAVLENIFGKSKRGASTITMQLTNLIEGKRTNKSIKDKYNQILLALEIEQLWTKEQILEAYLNLITFKGEIQGISAASKLLLHKEPSAINSTEAVILSVLINKPNAPLETILRKSITLCNKLKLDCKVKNLEDISQMIFHNYNNPANIIDPIASHIINHMTIDSSDKVVSTIDAYIQKYVRETITNNIAILRKSNVSDSAVLVIENKTGNVLSYVGNSGNLSSAKYVDGVIAKRQAGSTLKPFLYALAIEKGILNPSSVLDDSPVMINTGRGLYSPENYSSHYTGSVTLRQALGSSLNAPAVKTIDMVGVDEFYHFLKKLGINITNSSDFYGHSLSLGAIDLSLLELAQAYRVLALKGLYKPIIFQKGIKHNKSIRVISEETSFIISHMLSDREARSLSFGLENPLSTKFWSAVKTGTSKDMRDNWCIGYSQDYTVAVWVGNFSGKPMWNVSGISGAAQIWLEIINFLHSNKSSKIPEVPPGVVSREITFAGKTYMEFFLKKYDFGASDINNLKNFKTTKFIYPYNEIFIALDPDIPIENQHIFFIIEGYKNDLKVTINNEKMNLNSNILLWQPKTGQHKAMLFDKNNHLLDEIIFFVK